MERLKHQSLLLKVSEIQLAYNPVIKPSERPRISSSSCAYKLFLNNWDLNRIEMQEQFKVMILNRGNKVLGIFELSTGGVAGTVVDLKLLFAAALKGNASSMILCHNHPSGNLKPSEQDIQITRKIKEGGNLLEIAVLDHIILTSEHYFSFADGGLL